MSVQQNIYRQRISFSKIRSLVPIPNLIDIQKRSYDEFLQMNLLQDEREERGLKAVFSSMFPIHNGKNTDGDGSDATIEIKFVNYTVGHWACKCGKYVGLEHLRTKCKKCGHNIVTDHPKDPTVDCPKCGTRNKKPADSETRSKKPATSGTQDNQPDTSGTRDNRFATICEICNEPVGLHQKMSIEECVERGATMAAPLNIRISIIQYDKDDKGIRHFKQSQESDVYLGDLPMMTDRGTFVINGTERVIVSQLHRSPGAFFSIAPDQSLYSAQIIPYRGSWVEFEIDAKGLFYARIDRKRKFLGTTFLRAMLAVFCMDDLRANWKADNLDNQAVLSQFDKVLDEFDKKIEKPGVLDKLIDAAEKLAADTPDKTSGGRPKNAKFDEIVKKAVPEEFDKLINEYKEKGATNVVGKLLCELASIYPKTNNQVMLGRFYPPQTFSLKGEKLCVAPNEALIGTKALEDIKSDNTGEVIVAKGRAISRRLLDNAVKAGIKSIWVEWDILDGAVAFRDIVDLNTGKVIVEENKLLLLQKLKEEVKDIFPNKDFESINEILVACGIKEIVVFSPENAPTGKVFSETLDADHTEDWREAAKEIFKKIVPGEPTTLVSSKNKLAGMFIDPQKYDLSKVGRHKINAKLDQKVSPDKRSLAVDDFINTIHYLLRLKKYDATRQEHTDEVAPVRKDDIDHLGNRRVRSVGELLENSFRVGILRVQKTIKDKFSAAQDPNSQLQAHELIVKNPVIGAMKEFFGSSQLSQFMDQTNPLSEITHKRRLSALGPGGLSRDRAGFEVRDVHTSHYGRICPIETPEGPNIGLISSLSCYARINELGFIESPYLKVVDGHVIHYAIVTHVGDSKFGYREVIKLTDLQAENAKLEKNGKRPAKFEMHAWYLTAWEEDEHIIAQANVEVDENDLIKDESVVARIAGETRVVERKKVTLIDVSPMQLVSVAASLIPFLENDDANRALMGANMQRQAVPLIRTEAPIVGTGMEYYAARDSGNCVVCRRSGIVETVDANRIVVRVEDDPDTEGVAESGADIYTLVKYARSNQNTCYNQVPLVGRGEYVVTGQILADGPCCDHGELSLGRNLIVAYMPWRGYNFEDAILISERVIKEDHYTTIHIEEFEVHARDTKLGAEDITRDIPQIREDMLKNLDDSGIIRIGATVKHGDILVGKVTPKGETVLSPEEKLLRAIFGEKASDVKDASLTVPPGIEGTVVDVKVFTRKGVEKDLRTQQIERDQVAKWEKDLQDQERINRAESKKKIVALLKGRELSKALVDDSGKEQLLPANKKLTQNMLEAVPYGRFRHVSVAAGKERLEGQVVDILDKTDSQLRVLRDLLNERIDRLVKGDELMPGVQKTVKVYIAVKRKLQVGDKMAGRHGNKGVVSRILPVEDMPYLPDGTPVDVVLNPLGVPSRMNIGQVLETHLGWAGKVLGVHFATPVFDGARESEIKEWLKKAWEKNGRCGPDTSGKTSLFDGMTGEPFEQPVVVGCSYMLKLHHLVDNKIHARSIGPYSLITQQPLGGKAQFGGQRFGEMEVWALEAYGAANILQELLTYKSDDMYGRTQIYQAIIKGEPIKEPGLPESFNVVRKELNALCIDMAMLTQETETEAEEEERPPYTLSPVGLQD